MTMSISHYLPHKIRVWGRRMIASIIGDTVSQGWDNYARNFKANPGSNLGDEWNEPAEIGMDVSPDQIVPTLDRTVFQPFLTDCDVILEIGSGGGRFTEILLPKCQKVIATDTSPTMLTLLKKRFESSPKLVYVLLDGLGFSSIADKSVDAVFSYDVFVHLEQWDIYNYLCEIRRVLKNNGKALIHYANAFSDLGWKRFLADIPQQLNRPKVYGKFGVMTPDVFKELAHRSGLLHLECITNIVRRDAISLLRSPGY